MNSEIKGLLFDKDGTLFNFHATWAGWTRDFIRLATDGPSAEKALAEAFGFDMDALVFAPSSIIVAATPEIILGTTLDTLPHLDRELLERQLLASSSKVALSEAVPLVALLDDFLSHGLQLGVATNDLEAVAHAHLASSAITGKFAFIAGSDSGHGAKPEPGMQKAFCRATGLAPPQVAMIGDSIHDLVSGRAAGMVTVAVLTGPACAGELAPFADVTLPDIGDIPGWLGLGERASNAT